MATEVFGRYADSYDLDTALKLDIEDMVTLLSPFDAPFLGTYNGLENTPVPSILPRGEVFETKYEWLEDELLTPRTTLDAAYTSGGLAFTVQPGEALRFQVDDLVDVNDVQYRVTAINYNTDVLTVEVWSGTDQNHADNDLVIGIGTLPAEGSDPGEARASDRSRKFNYTQIFGPYPVEMSETEQVVAKYGVASEWQHQVAKRVKEMAVAMETALIYGVRKTDATGKRRSMGGLNYFIDAANGSTIDSSTTSLAGTAGEDALRTLQQSVYAKGGDPRLVVVGPDQKPDISDWRKSDIRFQQTENKRGQIVTTFESDFNVVDVLMHRWVKKNNLFLFNHSQAEVATLTGRGLKWVNTAKTGDRDQSYVITEKGFKFRAAQHAAKMTALT